jgi:membrane dipeptidase
MKLQADASRRQFLSGIAVTASAGILMRPRLGWAADVADARVAEIVATTIGIDTHNHVDVPLTAAEMPGPDIDLVGEMKRSGLSAICMTFATDYQPGDAYDRFLKGLASMDRQLERNGMTRSLTPADIRTAHKKRQPTVIQAIEGAHFLQGHIERVEEAYKRGLRHFGLLHDSDASVPLGDVYTNPSALWRTNAVWVSRDQRMQSARHPDRSCACQRANHRSGAQGHNPAGHHLPYRT